MANLQMISTRGVLARHGIPAECGYVSPGVLAVDLNVFQGKAIGIKFVDMVVPEDLQAGLWDREIKQRLLLQPLLQGLQSLRYAVC